MNDDLVERVARAIVARRNLPSGCDINWAIFREDARAAIAAMPGWEPIATVPEGTHVLLWFPLGERGVGGMETAMVFRGYPDNPGGLSYWTHGGPNSGSDWEPREPPTHWRHLPDLPALSDPAPTPRDGGPP